jgi:hypothetical protein
MKRTVNKYMTQDKFKISEDEKGLRENWGGSTVHWVGF